MIVCPNDENRQVSQNDIIYSLNKNEKTASVINIERDYITFPRAITYKSTEYTITTISKNSLKYSGRFSFAQDSKLQIIEKEAFSNSSIERISIPSSLIELKEGWCKSTPILNEINVDENNQNFKLYENQFILGKSNPEKENYNRLIISVRNIKTAKIPNYIEIIDPYSFQDCKQIQKIDIPNDSKLLQIKEFSFSKSSIQSITIPSSVKKIGKSSFFNCKKLIEIKIPKDSNLKIIEEEAFYGSSIESFFIPSNLIELKEGWCRCASKLTKIDVDSKNKIFQL